MIVSKDRITVSFNMLYSWRCPKCHAAQTINYTDRPKRPKNATCPGCSHEVRLIYKKHIEAGGVFLTAKDIDNYIKWLEDIKKSSYPPALATTLQLFLKTRQSEGYKQIIFDLNN